MRKKYQKKSILVIRMSAIGDIVMATPVAEAIKRDSPNAQVTWLVQPEYRSLLENNPFIDAVITWDKNTWKSLWKSGNFTQLLQKIREFRDELHSYKFDTAIDLQGLLKSGLLTWLSGARCKIGLGSKEGSSWLMTKTFSRNLGENTQIGSEYRYLVNQLGMRDYPWRMRIDISHNFEQGILKKVRELTCGEPFAVICPFTTRPQKHWFDGYWQQIALRLRGRYKLRTLVLGGPAEASRAAEIAKGCGAVNMAGQTSLEEAAALVKHAHLLIGVDTGLTHMGHAFKTPTLALFGSTCPYTFTGLGSSRVVFLDMDCAPCRRNPTCGGSFDCMRKITPDMVLTEIKPLLAARTKQRLVETNQVIRTRNQAS